MFGTDRYPRRSRLTRIWNVVNQVSRTDPEISAAVRGRQSAVSARVEPQRRLRFVSVSEWPADCGGGPEQDEGRPALVGGRALLRFRSAEPSRDVQAAGAVTIADAVSADHQRGFVEIGIVRISA